MQISTTDIFLGHPLLFVNILKIGGESDTGRYQIIEGYLKILVRLIELATLGNLDPKIC